MKRKPSIYIRLDMTDVFDQVTDAQLGQFLRMTVDYYKTGKADLNGYDQNAAFIFGLFKGIYCDDIAKYREICEKRKRAAKDRWGDGGSDSK